MAPSAFSARRPAPGRTADKSREGPGKVVKSTVVVDEGGHRVIRWLHSRQ